MTNQTGTERKQKSTLSIRIEPSPFQSLEKWLESDSDLRVNEARREIKSQAARKLQMLDEMHRELVSRAQKILETAHEDLRLHEISVNGKKIRGKIYYLFSDDETEFFSILEPNEYLKADPGVRFISAYRLNEDNTWSIITIDDDRLR